MAKLKLKPRLANQNQVKSIPEKPKPTLQLPVNTSASVDYTFYWLTAGLILVVIVYFPSLFNAINLWDDNEYLNNPYVKDLSLQGIVKTFSVYFAGNYHPLTLLSLGIDRFLGGGSPFMFHFTNLLLHLLNTFLVYLLVKRLTQNNLLAVLTCIMFGVHTLHVESVAWVAERKDVLYAFFFLLSLTNYSTYASSQKKLYYWLSLLFFLLSLLAKGQAVVLAAILPFIDYLKGRKWFSIKVLLEKIPFFFLLLVFGWVAFRAQASAKFVHLEYFTLPERFAFASYGFTQYLVKSIFPSHLSVLYPYPPVRLEGGIPSFYWLFIFALPLFFIASFFLFKRSKIYAFGLGMFFLSILPLLQIIPVGGAIMADRYFYIPSVGLLLCFAFGLLEIFNTTVRSSLLVIFVLLLAVLSFLRCMVWKDNITLWGDLISKYDNYQLGYYNRGISYYTINERSKAIDDLSRAIEIDPKYKDAYFSRGIIYDDLDQLDNSIADYSRVIMLDPKYIQAYVKRGVDYGKIGQIDNAIADCSKAIGIDPGNIQSYTNRSVAYSKIGLWNNAIADCSKAIGIDPKYIQAYENRAVDYLNLGQLDNAIADCCKAIEIDPNDVKAYSYRGFIFNIQGHYDKAVENYSIAITIDPKYKDAFTNRGIAYLTLGQWEKAIADFSKVLEFDPNNALALKNREFAYRQLHNEKR